MGRRRSTTYSSATRAGLQHVLAVCHVARHPHWRGQPTVIVLSCELVFRVAVLFPCLPFHASAFGLETFQYQVILGPGRMDGGRARKPIGADLTGYS